MGNYVFIQTGPLHGYDSPRLEGFNRVLSRQKIHRLNLDDSQRVHFQPILPDKRDIQIPLAHFALASNIVIMTSL